jgi:hypothetical protein
VAADSVSALTYLPAQGVIVGSQYSPPRLVVYNASTGDLTNTLGSSGTGTTVGATVQFGRPRWTTTVPWSPTAVLVPDDVNDRVVEVDTVTGLLVKVWLSGVTNPFGVAATGSRIAVGWGAETLTTSKLDMYDLAGTLQWSVGGAYVGDSSSAGTLLGDPAQVQFSQDGSYVLLVETTSARVTKWSTHTGEYLGSVGSGYYAPYAAHECWTGAGVGTLVTSLETPGRLSRVSDTGTVTTRTFTGSSLPLGVVVVPGRSVVLLGQTSGLHFLSSVAIADQPVSANVTVPSSATFTVNLTANSASSGVTFEWTKGGVTVGSSSPSYTYDAVDTDGGQAFSVVCTVSHTTGRVVTSAANLTVQVGWSSPDAVCCGDAIARLMLHAG